jgi:hypothetical protein
MLKRGYYGKKLGLFPPNLISLLSIFSEGCCSGNTNLFMCSAAVVDRLELLSTEHLPLTRHPQTHSKLLRQSFYRRSSHSYHELFASGYWLKD